MWDNVERLTASRPVASATGQRPSKSAQPTLLRDLVQQTRCKILLTSRRDERPWLGDLPARVRLLGMPMPAEPAAQAALAARHSAELARLDRRPLLRYAGAVIR